MGSRPAEAAVSQAASAQAAAAASSDRQRSRRSGWTDAGRRDPPGGRGSARHAHLIPVPQALPVCACSPALSARGPGTLGVVLARTRLIVRRAVVCLWSGLEATLGAGMRGSEMAGRGAPLWFGSDAGSVRQLYAGVSRRRYYEHVAVTQRGSSRRRSSLSPCRTALERVHWSSDARLGDLLKTLWAGRRGRQPGWMFLLWWKALSGSYLALTSASRR